MSDPKVDVAIDAEKVREMFEPTITSIEPVTETDFYNDNYTDNSNHGDHADDPDYGNYHYDHAIPPPAP